jgi:lipid II:glycine glycyltransferase (peptidoglycan interpeptide bridge formation enzyme)
MPLISTELARPDLFSVEVDSVDQAQWSDLLQSFGDASIYQTRGYAEELSGTANLSQLLLRNGSQVVAAAQVRLVKIPVLGRRVAYVYWSPLWQLSQAGREVEIFRRAARALRAEYVVRRRCMVRIVSQLCEEDNELFRRILEEEGYAFQPRARLRRTMLMDLRPTLEALHQGLHQKWRYHLKKAQKQKLEITEGGEDDFFARFERVHAQMMDRKQFEGGGDPKSYRRIQKNLKPHEKMRVFLCQAENQICAGGIVSAIGNMGIYLFGATNDLGVKTYGSYLVHWRMLQWVKQQGCACYDLNGINPVTNPGGFQFKSQLAGVHGRDVHVLGQFDAYPSAPLKWFAGFGELLMAKLPRVRQSLRARPQS